MYCPGLDPNKTTTKLASGKSKLLKVVNHKLTVSNYWQYNITLRFYFWHSLKQDKVCFHFYNPRFLLGFLEFLVLLSLLSIHANILLVLTVLHRCSLPPLYIHHISLVCLPCCLLMLLSPQILAPISQSYIRSLNFFLT